MDIECIVAAAGESAEFDALEKTGRVRIARVVRPSRGAQLNAGAVLARGTTLLFHHADSELTLAHVTSLLAAMQRPEIVGGAFCRAFDNRPRICAGSNRSYVVGTAAPARCMAISRFFARGTTFYSLGGFAPIPLMEDVEFSGRLRKAGPVAVLDPPMRTSDRQHRRHGAWRTSFRNGLFLMLYWLGVSPETLHRWYYRRGTQTESFPRRQENKTGSLPL